MHAVAVGTVIENRYELLEVIGTGGYGVVYKARQIGLDRHVAVKILRADADDDAWRRFEREARILSDMKNAHITSFYAFGHWQGAPYMVTEYVEGKDLQKELYDNKPLGEARSLSILVQVCNAVAAAHVHEIIHRDLKPSNVMLSSDDFVRVIDFGLAKLIGVSPAQSLNLTEAGCTVGSVLYMSPEQCEGKPVDARSDIYALGALLYHCLTGKPMFTGGHSVVVMQKHISDSPPKLTEDSVIPAYIAHLQAILDHCLEKDPKDRYQTVADLLTDIELVRSLKPPRIAKPKAKSETKPTVAQNKAHRGKRVLMLLGGIMLVSLATAFLLDRKLTSQVQLFIEENSLKQQAESQSTEGVLTKVRLANLYWDTRRKPEAQEIYSNIVHLLSVRSSLLQDPKIQATAITVFERKESDLEKATSMLSELGRIYWRTGNMYQAEKVFHYNVDRMNTGSSQEKTVAWADMANFSFVQGNYNEAERCYRETDKALNRVTLPDPMVAVFVWERLGDCCAKQGKRSDARSFYRQALIRTAAQDRHADTARLEQKLQSL